MRTLWRPALGRITPYEAGKPLEILAAEAGLSSLVRLSANEHPVGPSPRV
ncbi:MAG: histidinol-phosphate transaminase, partial [Candidatus Rokubacteria bacterium]|nr:histidinol-phosphate transaminase [Candidatus Rokubacteria bacterium]